MRRTGLVTLLLTLVAAGAAPDALLFCRGGRVWLLPAGQTEPVAAIAEDAGWQYAQPTWVDNGRFVTMRLLGGETLRSHVGLVTQITRLPVKPGEIKWVKSAGGALGIGACPDYRKVALTKIARLADDRFESYLTVGPVDGDWGTSRKLETYETGDIGGPRARIRFAPDGKRAVLPTFPSDVSALVMLWDTARGCNDDPYWLRWQWLTQNGGDGAVSCIGWLADGRILLGTLTTGLYEVNPKTKTVRALDKWETGKASVTELTVNADHTRAYYSVDVYGANGESASEIRLLDQDGRTSTILKDASSPDAMPAAG